MPTSAPRPDEIHEGLNVVENWDSAHGFCFGKGGEMATSRIDEQEVSALALHLLQASSSM
jgi:TnpA family transposase